MTVISTLFLPQSHDLFAREQWRYFEAQGRLGIELRRHADVSQIKLAGVGSGPRQLKCRFWKGQGHCRGGHDGWLIHRPGSGINA